MDAQLQAFLQQAMANQGGGAGADGDGSGNHIMSFKAGKCTKWVLFTQVWTLWDRWWQADREGKMVTADKRKGLVYLTVSSLSTLLITRND